MRSAQEPCPWPATSLAHHVTHGNEDASDTGQEGPEKGTSWHRAGRYCRGGEEGWKHEL